MKVHELITESLATVDGPLNWRSSRIAGYTSLLSQLTTVGEYDEDSFSARFQEIQNLKDMYKIMVIEGVLFPMKCLVAV